MRIQFLCLMMLFITACNKTEKIEKKEKNVNSKISSIEENLNIEINNNKSFIERLSIIDSMIKEKVPYKKFAIPYYKEDTIAVNSKLKGFLTLGCYNYEKYPYAVINYNGEVDTLEFDQELKVIPFAITNIEKGKNKFHGVISDQNEFYPFKGYFHGK